MITYKGIKTDGAGPQSVIIEISLNPIEIEPLRHRLVKHSTDGFQWGYGGSGPADLALNILYDFYNRYYSFLFDEEIQKFCQKHYQRFKEDFVAKWENKWEITNQQIQDWLINEAKKK